MKWLTSDECSLPIPVISSSVHLIQTPTEFYEKLMEKIKNASKRIVLTSLYLGTGSLEQDLVANIRRRMQEEPELKVGMLLDFFRGTRTGNEGSVELLQPLAKNAQIKFFHHPNMRGLLLNMLPERVNEIIGLQHMKFFIFDDSIILSGANLSDSYFTNRQDRYMLIENNRLLVDFFMAVFNTISSCSLSLNKTGSLVFEGEKSLHPFAGSANEFQKVMASRLNQIFIEFKEKVPMVGKSAEETFICPFLQIGSFNFHQEVDLLTKLFGYQEDDIEITISTGYFNLYEAYTNLILKKNKCPVTIMLASPEANSFYHSAGLSRYIPSLYVHNSHDFFRQVSFAVRRKKKVTITEYIRPKWTFHAKGIWLASEEAAATVVGSSNYGYRSVFRDLEVGALLVTKNENLMQQIAEEKKALMKFCIRVEKSTFLRKDHFVPVWIKYSCRFIRHFF